ncbi:MAG: DUF1549 domain-containing protein [Sandaracinaceae bacterium]|nr:MAG: DUF1549 domain-containing protein [Sandaracinaceae bacterium]
MRGPALLAFLVAVAAGCDGEVGGMSVPGGDAGCVAPPPVDPPPPIQPISPTRQLRRVTLSLAGRTPTVEELDAVLEAGDEAAQRAAVHEAVDALLASPEFYRAVLAFGHDWIPVTGLRTGVADESYWGSQAANLFVCDDGTTHAGAFYLNGEARGDSGPAWCDDAAIDVHEVEPWWAPGTTVRVLGPAGSGVRTVDGQDCGLSRGGYYQRVLPVDGCSCGPNLVYCIPGHGFGLNTDRNDAKPRRQGWDEPARLLAHLAWHDRPLTDLIAGNYTVAPVMLRHLYVRMGRQLPENAALDDEDAWWRGPFTGVAIDPLHASPDDPLAWQEVVLERLNPTMMSLSGGARSGDLSRTYHHDPRVDAAPIEGIPAAGVLTSLAVQSSFSRERVRAARMLETFACYSFNPPPPDADFGPVGADISRSGQCQHCHRVMDPAAIHFKRWSFGGHYIQETSYFPGVGPWRWENIDRPEVQRFEQLYIPGTVLTPATEEQIASNPDARLLDFLGPEHELFGARSDGTNGPLGFAKLVIDSGRFDECAVRRIYHHFVGRPLDPARESGYIDALTAEFVEGGRKLRPFVGALMRSETFLHGAIRRAR